MYKKLCIIFRISEWLPSNAIFTPLKDQLIEVLNLLCKRDAVYHINFHITGV